jgi:hypothetical protein
MYDYILWLSEVLVFACLGVDFAIICALMPVLWPTVKAMWSHTVVTKQVFVTSESCHDDALRNDLEMSIERVTS